MKQEVINYEFQILQNPLIRKSQPRLASSCDQFRYSSWKLCETIQLVLGDKPPCDVKWIGNCNNSYVISYFYCVVQLCMNNPDIMVKLKYALYKVCQYCLNLSQQKSFVEFLNIILQEDGLLGHFFQTNRHAEQLLVKIYQTSLSVAKIQASTSDFNPFERLKLYSKKVFGFLNVKSHHLCENVLEISAQGQEQPLYILKEKDCYFVLDYDFPTPKKGDPSTKPPQIDQYVIIDEMDEEDTVVIENDRYSSKSKTDSQATSKEKTNHRVPKFLHNNHRQAKEEVVPPDPSQQKKNHESHQNRVEKQNRMTLPFKQTFSNKLLTNFQLEKPEEKSFKEQNKSHSKSIKNRSPDILGKDTNQPKERKKKPVQSSKPPPIVPYASKIKQKDKEVQGKAKIPSSNRYNYKGEEPANNYREESSVEQHKKVNSNNAEKMAFQSPHKPTGSKQGLDNPQISHFDSHHPQPIAYSNQNKIRNAISPRTSGNLLKVNFMHSHHENHK